MSDVWLDLLTSRRRFDPYPAATMITFMERREHSQSLLVVELVTLTLFEQHGTGPVPACIHHNRVRSRDTHTAVFTEARGDIPGGWGLI